MIRGLFSAVVGTVLMVSGSPAQATDCIELGGLFKNLDTAQAIQLKASGAAGKTYKKLYDVCDKLNTFNGKPLPKYGNPPKRRKCSTDPNMVKGIWKFPDGTIVFISKASVDADGSPLSQSATGTNQPETSLKWDDTGKSVDAEAVPFIVIPLNRAGVSFSTDAGVTTGDLNIAVRGNKCSADIVADQGPGFRLGEGSLRMHEDLGNPQCVVANQVPCKKLVGGGSGRGLPSVGYIIFPDSKRSQINVSDLAAIQSAAMDRAMVFLRKFQRAP
ncbi:MAG: glycoside hydrolase family 75 protein [Novosphingobium sp.]|uniref:glycoside hydrolase family 75 protein n=1 Tax=Novosphingobium sp. TaxID=1874826 RepID=UPI0030166F0E